MQHEDGRVVTIPVHAGKTLGKGLLSKILRDADTKLHSKTLPRALGTPLLAKERGGGEVTPMNATRYELTRDEFLALLG